MKKWSFNKEFYVISILNMVLVYIALFVFVPSYETNDDFTMGVISSGTYGTEYSQFLVFTNLVYGYVLKFLGWICSSLNWYVVSQYLLILMSIIAIMYIFSKYTSLAITVIVNVVLWYLTFFEMFRKVQFTRTAGLVTVAGCVMIWYSIMKKNRLSRVMGIIFCVIGSFIRVESFPIAISFFCAFALIHSLWNKLSKKKLIEIGGTIGLTVFIVGAFLMVDKAYYMISPEWEGYTEYNSTRAELLDYGFPQYNENAEKYEKLGFSRNDVAVVKRWMLSDFKKVKYEDLKSMSDWKEPQKINKELLKDYLLDFQKRIYTNKMFWLWLIIVLVSLNLNMICKIFAGVNVCLVGILYGYLYYIQRIVPRVEYVIWISAIISLIFCMLSYYKVSKFENSKIQIGIITCVFVFASIFVGMKYTDEYAVIQVGYKQQPRDILEKISKEKSNVYLLDTPSFGTTCLCYKPYLKVPDYYLSNFYYMGGWDTESPFNENLVKKLGLENPMEDQIYKDNVYFVKNLETGVEGELQYLRENYNKNVDVKLVEGYNGYGIYKFSVKE